MASCVSLVASYYSILICIVDQPLPAIGQLLFARMLSLIVISQPLFAIRHLLFRYYSFIDQSGSDIAFGRLLLASGQLLLVVNHPLVALINVYSLLADHYPSIMHYET